MKLAAVLNRIQYPGVHAPIALGSVPDPTRAGGGPGGATLPADGPARSDRMYAR